MIRRSSKLPSYLTQAEVRAPLPRSRIYGTERSSVSPTPMGFESEKSCFSQRREKEPQDAPSRAVSRISNPIVATFLAYLLLLVFIPPSIWTATALVCPWRSSHPLFFAQILTSRIELDHSAESVVPGRCAPA
jgi:hypothetical protein